MELTVKASVFWDVIVQNLVNIMEVLQDYVVSVFRILL